MLSNKAHTCLLLIAASLALGAGQASADTRSFSIPTKGVNPAGGATVTNFVNLGGTGTPTMFMNFVLPRDYKANGAVSVVLYVRTNSTVPCNAVITVPQFTRSRINADMTNSTDGVDPGGSVFGFTTNDKILSKVVKITAAAVPNGQKPGDAFGLQIAREADNAADTCNGTVFVNAIDVRYAIPNPPAP